MATGNTSNIELKRKKNTRARTHAHTHARKHPLTRVLRTITYEKEDAFRKTSGVRVKHTIRRKPTDIAELPKSLMCWPIATCVFSP